MTADEVYQFGLKLITELRETTWEECLNWIDGGED